MENKGLIDATIAYVRDTLKEAEGGHDWFHIERVWKNAKTIAAAEPGADTTVVELAALLHDIADSKFHNGDESIGPAKAEAFLRSLNAEEHITEHVVNIVRGISFKGGKEKDAFYSVELGIVRDADRLDAIGAIGVARAFNYGGFKGRALHDPSIAPDMHMDKEAYKKNTAPTINHFYEKLLLLKDRMHTVKGRAMAEERHAFLELYLERFLKEWEGE